MLFAKMRQKCYSSQLRLAHYLCHNVTEKYFHPDITYIQSPFHLLFGFASVFSFKKPPQTNENNYATQGIVSDELTLYFSFYNCLCVAVVVIFCFSFFPRTSFSFPKILSGQMIWVYLDGKLEFLKESHMTNKNTIPEKTQSFLEKENPNLVSIEKFKIELIGLGNVIISLSLGCPQQVLTGHVISFLKLRDLVQTSLRSVFSIFINLNTLLVPKGVKGSFFPSIVIPLPLVA